jgi:hypothetical protein
MKGKKNLSNKITGLESFIDDSQVHYSALKINPNCVC